MPIDFAKLRGLTLRKIIAALHRDGFELAKHHGATRLFRHPDGRKVTIHAHSPGQTLKVGMLQEIIQYEAMWTEEDLSRLKLLK